MAAYLPQFFDIQFITNAGAIADSYVLYTYEDGTTTPKATYTDATGATPNANPVPLNSAGRCSLWLGSGKYSFELKTAAGGSLIKRYDGVDSTSSISVELLGDLGSTSAANKGAGMVGYDRAQAYGVDTIGYLLRNMLPNAIGDLGCVGDGVTDDYPALQAACDLGIAFYLPPTAGGYRIVPPDIEGLKFAHGTRIYGGGNWSAVASTFDTTSMSRIVYDGAGGTNSTVVRVSDAAVGTDPATAGTRDMQNCGMSNVTIDGNEKAEIGLYQVRAWSSNQWDYLTFTGTLKHAALAMKCWNGTLHNWMAFKNKGAGITIGKNVFSWSSATCDQSTLIGFFGYYSGHNKSAVAQNVFSDTQYTDTFNGTGAQVAFTLSHTASDITALGVTIGGAYSGSANWSLSGTTLTFNVAPPVGVNNVVVKYLTINSEKEYGIGIFGGRALTLINAQANNNGGAGVYVHPLFKPVNFIGGYIEGNGKSSGASAQWNIWFVGEDGGGSTHCVFQGMLLGLVPAVRQCGTEPARIEGGPKYSDFPTLGSNFLSDWGNYRVKDCDRNVVFTGTKPRYFDQQLNGARNLGITGKAVINCTTGSVVTLQRDGVISGVTRSSAGVYAVALSEAYSSAPYSIVVTTTADYRVAPTLASIANSGFTIEHRDIATSTLTDAGSRITIEVGGAY